MSTPTELENLLSEALTARADQVGAADLSPAFAPHVTQPWWTRVRVALVGGSVLVAAAVAVILIAVSGNDGDRSQVIDPSTNTPSPTTTSEPTDGPTDDPTDDPTDRVVPDGLLPADQPTWSEVGETVRFDDGTSATITGDGTTMEVTADGATSQVDLPAEAESGIAPFQLQLGQAGVGYLVLQSAGEFASYVVVVVRDGQAVAAVSPPEVPFGSEYSEETGAAFQTWTTGEGSAIYGRVRMDVEGYPDDAYMVYRWEVAGPGEGGGPDSEQVDLVYTELGVACFERDGSAYAECAGSVSSGAGPVEGSSPELLPEDSSGETRPGQDYVYPGGTTVGLVRVASGYELSVTLGVDTQRVPVPGVTNPTVLQEQVRLGDTTGYLLRDESGDSTNWLLFAMVDGRPVQVEEPAGGDVTFDSGFIESGQSTRLYLAGGGTALYTEVRADFEATEYTVYEWSIAPSGVLQATEVGTYSD